MSQDRIKPFLMAGEDDGDTGVAVQTKTRTQRPPMYKVLLLNDDYTPMEFVVETAGERQEVENALAIVTEWQEFRSPDFAEIRATLTHPVIFDADIEVPKDVLDSWPERIRLRGLSHVSRFNFEMHSHRLFVSDTVRLCLSVELVQWSP